MEKQLHQVKRILLISIFSLCPLALSAATAKVSNLDSINFGNINPTSTQTQTMSDNVCVYSSSGAYTVTVNTGTNKYELINGPAKINFEVYWNNNANEQGGTQLAPGVAKQFSNASTVDPCLTDNANVKIVVPGNQLSSAPAGSFHTQLTITISPV